MKHEKATGSAKQSPKAIAYYRVSTVRQGASGLGLEAQQAAVKALCKSRGWQIIEPPFTDIESGRHDERPELAKALAKCKEKGAILVIAKLDRLARKASFVMRLQDAAVRFVAADMPQADETMVGFMAVLAQAEAKAISERTSAAIRARIARGKPWDQGKENLAKYKAWEKSIAAKKKAAREHANGAMTHAVNYRSAGWTLQKIADELNKAGATTREGHPYTPTTVRRLLKMAATEKPKEKKP